MIPAKSVGFMAQIMPVPSDTMTVQVLVIAGLVICVLLLVWWLVRLQRWSRAHRQVIDELTQRIGFQGQELNDLRNEILDAQIRLDRLDPQ